MARVLNFFFRHISWASGIYVEGVFPIYVHEIPAVRLYVQLVPTMVPHSVIKPPPIQLRPDVVVMEVSRKIRAFLLG